METSTLPKINEVSGPILWEEITIPQSLENELTPKRDGYAEKLLQHVRAVASPNLKHTFETDQGGVSSDFVFRGFRRKRDYPAQTSTVSDRLHNPYIASNQLQERGYELIVGDKGDVIKVTQRPTVALGFGYPKKDEIGYLAIYDDRDNFFGDKVVKDDRELAAQIGLQPDSTLRDRLVAVIQLEHYKERHESVFMKLIHKITRQAP